MMLDIEVSDQIADLLDHWIQKVKNLAAMGYGDSKIAAEEMSADLLNIVYNLSLEPLSKIKHNYPAIDLGDKGSGICYQVTFENTTHKIEDTKLKYKKYRVNETFPELRILIWDNKPKHRAKDSIVFYKEDILRNIGSAKKKEFLSCLEKHLNICKSKASNTSLEVTTINQIIEIISKPQDLKSYNIIKHPYPAQKIKLRFGEYQGVIKEQLGKLEANYQDVMDKAREQLNTDALRQMETYWCVTSIECLYNSNNNAQKALTDLIEKIKMQIVGEYSECALKYFVLHELRLCNIFPLKEEEKELIEMK